MNRRLLISAVPAALLPSGAVVALGTTPAQTAGPFYPERKPADHDNDLVRVAGQPRRAQGTELNLSGRVLDANGEPVTGAVVEIWQCDATGRYHHPRDRRSGPADPGFQGYGRDRSEAGGGYRFRTIRPVAYPGRTPHIHFAVTAPGGQRLVTQMYVLGEPDNQRDFLYTRIPPELRERVTVALTPATTPARGLYGTFDIVLSV